MKVEKNDFVKIEFDIYANDKLVQTTDEKKGKESNLQVEKYGAQTIIVGKEFILKALDEDLMKNAKTGAQATLDLKPENAYGKRNKDLIKVLPKSAFDEHKMRAVPGIVYDFNGTLGTVKSVIGGRVMVDFNHPFANKNIRLVYKVVEKIEDIKEKINSVFSIILKMPQDKFKVEKKDKIIEIQIPQEIISIKKTLAKSLEEFIPQIKNYELRIEKFKN